MSRGVRKTGFIAGIKVGKGTLHALVYEDDLVILDHYHSVGDPLQQIVEAVTILSMVHMSTFLCFSFATKRKRSCLSFT